MLFGELTYVVATLNQRPVPDSDFAGEFAESFDLFLQFRSPLVDNLFDRLALKY